MELFDTHTHLYADEFDNDRESIIASAIESGINRMLLPAIDSESHQNLIHLASQYPGFLLPMMGLHPTSVNAGYKKELSIVERYLSQRSLFYGIGEIGTDLYWDKTWFTEQTDAFLTQIRWAKEMRWPVVIHTRDSMDITLDLLEPIVDNNLKGVFHCFGGTVEQARRIISYGFKLGIGGVVTFKNSNLSEVIKVVGIEHLVLETDSPYLAPVPHRGKRNESKYLLLIAQKVAEIFELSVDDVARITTQNANQLFISNSERV